MKTKLTRRIFSALLAVIMAAATFVFSQPAFAAASGELVKDKITWSLDDSGTLTISGTGAMKNYSSDSISSNPVYTKRPWNEYQNSIKAVVIGEGITEIGSNVFRNMSILKSVSIGNSVNLIGWGAFYGCNNLKKVTTGKNVTIIGDSAFESCSALETFNFPEELVQINKMAFKNCSGLKIVTFGKELGTIGNYAFENCSGLRVINIPESVTAIGKGAFKGCTALQKIAIPEGVTIIKYEAFKYCSNLATMYLPYSVKNIDQEAFSNCGLKRIYYSGTKEQFGDIVVGSYNDAFKKAELIPGTRAIAQYLPVLSTDIRSYLFGSEIESYNVNGSTCIVAEDLANYGFTVVWDGNVRTLTITHPSEDFTQASKKDFGAKTGSVGEKLTETVPTDILTYIGDEEIPSFNIGGKTVIYIDSLAAFGKVAWDAGARTISVN